MDEGPDAPVETGDAAEEVDFGEQAVDGLVGGCGGLVRGVGGEVGLVAGEVFAEEAAALGARGEGVVGAFETAPFGEVVGDVEGGGRGGGVFVVDEADG